MVERVPLHITDNMPALKRLARDDNIIKVLKRIDRLPGLAHRMFVELLRIQNDQEKSYIVAKRYIRVMDHLLRLAADRQFLEICYGNEYRKVKSMIADLEADLEARYEDMAHRKIIEQNSHNQSQLAMQKVIFFPKMFITSAELYRALTTKLNMLMVDIRPCQDFEQSRISTDQGRLINIPEDVLVPGLSANTLVQRLKEPTQQIWHKRDSFDVIVLMDWNTDSCNYYGSKLEQLRLCIVEWDLNRTYTQDPVILDGGFKDFLESYPTEVINSSVFLSQTYSEIDELLTIDDVLYPELGSLAGVNLAIEGAKLYGDNLEEIQEQNFEFPPEESATPGEPVTGKAEEQGEKGEYDAEAVAILLNKARALKPKDVKLSADSKNASTGGSAEQNVIETPTIDRTTKPAFERVVGEGYVGIRNARNNCYMSCMLQCLKALPLIKSMFVSSNTYRSHIHKQTPTITTSFASLMRELWEASAEQPKVCYPEAFFELVYEINPVYRKGNHEDTFEFFIFLFNLLSEDCSYDLPRRKAMTEREKSWYMQLQGRSSCFVDLFYYQLKNSKVCWHCQKANLVFDSDSTLMLPISEEREREDLQSMLKEYLKENLVADYSCSDCKFAATIVNRKTIVLDPEILVIVLKRYAATDNGSFRKIETDIFFPTSDLKFGRSSYRLYAIAHHIGTMSAGHYYASVLINDATGTWVKFNDEQAVNYNCPIREAPNINSTCVGFFYVRQTTSEKRKSSCA